MYIVSYSSGKTVTCKAEESLSVRIGPKGVVEEGTPEEKIERSIEVEVDKFSVISFKVKEEDLKHWEGMLLGTPGTMITFQDFAMVLTEHLLKIIEDRKGIMSITTLRYYISHLIDVFERGKEDSRIKFGK